ncbi:MAG: cytochrome c oxidase subunit 4 [Actinomycetota bacterium]|nr:cytochrome c oxidase subunit 4 [Actinomycetota bacterium]
MPGGRGLKVEWRLFAGAAGFFAVTATAYWLISYEDAGTTMLAASVPAFAFIAAWLWFQNRNHGPRPEDLGDATQADGTGDVGYYPSSSAWPFILAAGVVVLANGMVFGPPIAALGGLLMVAGIVGYAREADTKA